MAPLRHRALGFGDRGFPDSRVLRLCGGASDVKQTRRAVEFLAAQREAARRIEARIRSELGPEALDGLYQLLDALGTEDQLRPADYRRQSTRLRGLLE